MVSKALKPPRIGVALGGGAARGWAHLGVILALQEAGIEPFCVAGTSIGSFVGAAWLSGGLPGLIDEVRQLDLRRLLPFLRMHLPRAGLIDGRALEPLIRRFVLVETFEDLPRPFGLTATDLRTGEGVWLRSGDLLSGILASTAVPGLFSPVPRDGRLLADGGLVDPVPVRLAREMGAEVVLAVDINHHIVRRGLAQGEGPDAPPADQDNAERASGEASSDTAPAWPRWLGRLLPPSRPSAHGRHARPRRPGLREVLHLGIAIGEVTIGDLRMQIDRPEVLVRPAVGRIPFLDFSRGAEAMEAGLRATREALADPAVRGTLGLATGEVFGVPSPP